MVSMEPVNDLSANLPAPEELLAAPPAGDEGWTFRDCWYFLLFAASLALPNLIYSGGTFFQTLHLMKWVFSLVPVGLMALSCGGSLFTEGKATPVKIDFLGAVWLLYLVFVTLQPQWVPLRSVPAWEREWFFFAGCVVFYLAAFAFFKEKWLRPIVWMAALNAAVNGVFAELQVRNITTPVFGLSLIMQTPGHYIGNTGQQNMFALWMALALFSSLFLFVWYGGSFSKNLRNKFMILGNLFFYLIISWCLICSTSRSGIISYWVGTFMLTLMILCTDRDRSKLRRIGIGVVLFFVVLAAFIISDTGRGLNFLMKTKDMVENIEDIAKRREIWETSWQVFKMKPMTGVGLGQYKWYYLQGQRAAMELHPEMQWQFTYWAHNEILQWFCEFGVWGGAVLLLTGAVWLTAFFRYVWRHRGRSLPLEFVWGASFLFLVWFDAIWTRPFHRIENSLWIALAFALTCRHMFWGEEGMLSFKKLPALFYRFAGALMVAGTVLGLWYGIDGIRGDLLLRQAESYTQDPAQKELLIRMAIRSQMVRDLATRELALLNIRTGEQRADRELLAEGLNQLIAVFSQQPTAQDFATLLTYARRSNIRSLLSFLEPYSPPPGSPQLLTEAEAREQAQRNAVVTPRQAPNQNSGLISITH